MPVVHWSYDDNSLATGTGAATLSPFSPKDEVNELGSIRNVIPFLSAIPADTRRLSANAIDSLVAPTISQRSR
jgi:hypothetical protein